MSVRAYKIIKKVLEDKPTFNCWRDDHIFELAHNDENYSDGGELEFSKEVVQRKLEEWQELLKNGQVKIGYNDHDLKESIETLEQIIKDCGEDDHVGYDCY